MPRFDSALERSVKPDDVVAYLQTLPEIAEKTSMAVSVESGKIVFIEIDGLSQPVFDSVISKVQLQFPTGF